MSDALIGVIGDGQAGEIGDILAEGQRALDVVAGQRLVGVILGDELRGQRIEARRVLRSPPFVKRAVLVVAAALIVEMVADLVADDGADAAIIDRRVGIGIEEGRLQDRGREDDLVPHRIGVGVDLHRSHAPFAPVDGPAELVEVAVPILELGRAHDVADEVGRG